MARERALEGSWGRFQNLNIEMVRGLEAYAGVFEEDESSFDVSGRSV